MRLPEIFGILGKSKVESHRFSTVESCPKIRHHIFTFNFCKSPTDATQNFENFDICRYNVRNIPEFLTFDGICQK